jgi:hypothetical protein
MGSFCATSSIPYVGSLVPYVGAMSHDPIFTFLSSLGSTQGLVFDRITLLVHDQMGPHQSGPQHSDVSCEAS